MAWLNSSGETVKRLEISNVNNKTAAVAKAMVQTGIGGNKMKSTAAAQDWLVTRRWQQQDNGDCGRNGGG